MLVVSSHYNLGNALLNLIQAYYRGKGSGPLLSNTKKAEEARINADFGWRHGIDEAIAEILTLERVKKFPLYERHEKIIGHEVDRVLKGSADLFHTAFPDGDIGSQIVDRLLALIDGERYATDYEDFRRTKVRKGELQATEADREWITAEAEAKRAEVDDIMRLLGPASEDIL